MSRSRRFPSWARPCRSRSATHRRPRAWPAPDSPRQVRSPSRSPRGAWRLSPGPKREAPPCAAASKWLLGLRSERHDDSRLGETLLVVRILPELGQRQPLARRSPGIRRREQHAPAEGAPLGLTDGTAVLDDPLPRAARAGAQAEDREVVEHPEAIFSDREFAAAAVCSARRLPASTQSDFSGAPRWTIGGSINFGNALKLSATPVSRTCASRRPERRPLNAAGPRFEPQCAHRTFEDYDRTARQRSPPTLLAFGASYEGAVRFPISTWGRRPG
jgi:hypothetical protein